MSESITYQTLKVSQFKFIHIWEFKVHAMINEHTTMRLVGILPQTRKEEDIHTQYLTPIEVYADLEEKKKVLFCGIITQIKVKKQAEYYVLEVEAKSYTFLMDIKRKSRSFQDKNYKLHALIDEITKQYPKGDSIVEIKDEPLNRLWVQYEETDWEFIKRIASHYNVGLFPHVALEGTHYFVNTPTTPDKKITYFEYEVTKNLDAYDHFRENETASMYEIDFIVYKVKSYELFELGDNISMMGHPFSVSELVYEMKKGILENTYKIQLQTGQKRPRIYHEKIKGVSLDGTVIEVTGDKIKVALDIDGKQDKAKAYWFTYSTIAASPDGSGWYFMPELNDRVRVYFPTNDEKDAFAISCIQQIKGNPDVKYIATIYDKKLVFTPDAITITANNAATIVLDKSGGISISGGNISINASETITMRAENDLIVSGKNQVEISCDKGGKVRLTEGGDVMLNGTKIKIN